MIGRDFTSEIAAMGQEVSVLVRSEGGQDDFNTAQESWTEERTTYATRTYPNRNTTVPSALGEFDRDNPVFIFPPDGSAPDPKDRIIFSGKKYELEAPTEYSTHVAMFGTKV